MLWPELGIFSIYLFTNDLIIIVIIHLLHINGTLMGHILHEDISSIAKHIHPHPQTNPAILKPDILKEIYSLSRVKEILSFFPV